MKELGKNLEVLKLQKNNGKEITDQLEPLIKTKTCTWNKIQPDIPIFYIQNNIFIVTLE